MLFSRGIALFLSFTLIALGALNANANKEQTVKKEDFVQDRFGVIKSMDEILECEEVYSDEVTEEILYRVTFQGVLLQEGNCTPQPMNDSQNCELQETHRVTCYYMVYDPVYNTLNETDFMCSSKAEDVVEKIYPPKLLDEG